MYEYKTPIHMVYADAVVLFIYLVTVILVQIHHGGILREIFRIKAVALIMAMITNMGKRLSIHYSSELIPLGSEMTFASVYAGWIHGHVTREPQMYLCYGLSSAFLVLEQMLNALLLYDIFLSCSKMKIRENILISLRFKMAILLLIPPSLIPLEVFGLQSIAATMSIPRSFALADLSLPIEVLWSCVIAIFSSYFGMKILSELTKSHEFQESNGSSSTKRHKFLSLVVITVMAMQILRFIAQFVAIVSVIVAYNAFDKCTEIIDDVFPCMDKYKIVFKICSILNFPAWYAIPEFAVVLAPALFPCKTR